MGPMRIGQLHPVAEQTYFTEEKEVTLRFSYLMKQSCGLGIPVCYLYFVFCVAICSLQFGTIHSMKGKRGQTYPIYYFM